MREGIVALWVNASPPGSDKVEVGLVKSYGRMLCLKNDPALIAAYKRYHQEVWPELLAGMREVGILKMKIYLRGTRLFMYVETVDDFDPARDLPGPRRQPRGRNGRR